MRKGAVELLGVRHIQKPQEAHAHVVDRHNLIMRELLSDIVAKIR